MKEMGRREETEKQHKFVIKIDPNNLTTYSNYESLLKEIDLNEEAKEQYKFIHKIKKSDEVTFKYSHLKKEFDEAGKQYKRVQKVNTSDVFISKNLQFEKKSEKMEKQYSIAVIKNSEAEYLKSGNFLFDVKMYKRAEEQYKLAIEEDPNDISVRCNYGYLLFRMRRNEEAEEQYKLAIEADPNNPTSHAIYSLFLVLLDLKREKDAIEKMTIASRLFKEKGDKIREHLVLAWLYEDLANKYYYFRNYQESGHNAELSGNEYIEASGHAGEEIKSTFLTKGYTLKGRAEIRNLNLKNIQPPYDEEKFKKIMTSIHNASKFYKKSAEYSPKDNQICNACSISMKCLSEMLDYMFLLIVSKSVKKPMIEDRIEKWSEELDYCEKIYNGNEKGSSFIKSLRELKACVKQLDRYKESTMMTDKLILEDCIQELNEIVQKIEGPLQKIIEDSAKQIDQCKSKIIPYKGINTNSSSEILDSAG